jgi:signal transduction histidine kinase
MDPLQVLALLTAGSALGGTGAWAWLRRQGRAASGAEGDAAAVAFVAKHMPVAVLLFASDGRIRFANRRAEQLLFEGTSPVGKNFLRMIELAPPEVRAALLGTSDALFNLELEGERQTFQMLRREVALEDEPHFLLMINPLTREVTRREIDLLKKVIAVISHELNNSLASIGSLVGSAHYIVENPENLPKLARVLAGIESRTKHLQHFLSEYAELSKLPKPRPTQVLWQPLVDRLRATFPTVRVDPPPPNSAWFDEVQIEQALLNLIKNALEAKGNETEVAVVFREKPDEIEVGVLDRGKGFSNEALQHGLLPFFSTKPGGSGLGLALCREIAEEHGGSLRIRAREGGGSAVYLVLPRHARTSRDDSSVALTLTCT